MAMYDVIVIGAGVEGSATALHLAKDGQKTLLLEQFPLPHSRGSSHGQSRITRKAYTKLHYCEMMEEASQFWLDLQRFSGVQIYKPIGFMEVGPMQGHSLRSCKQSLERTGAAFTELSPQTFSQRYPMLSYPANYGALLDPTGGLLRADRILRLFQNVFKKHGGEIGDGQKVLSVIPQGQDSVKVITEKGQLTSRRVVLCCGPWTSTLTSPLGLTLPLKAVRITVCYWKARDPSQYSIDKLPTFFEEGRDGSHDVYGLPCEEYPGFVKICLHHGPEIDPDHRDAVDSSWVLSQMSDYVRQHFPGLESTPAVVETCMYTNTPDKDFILDTHPKWKNIVIGAGFSGHGFKLAPVVGRVLSQLAQGKAPSYDLSPFRISRFSPQSQL